MASNVFQQPPSVGESTASLTDEVIQIFTEKITFNKTLGFSFQKHSETDIRLVFDMQDRLVGNFMRGNLHGGVISSALDVVGGLVAFMDVLNKRTPRDNTTGLQQFGALGTIDLRVDYLRPGLGRQFEATGFVLRTGSKVSVTRMELHNDDAELIAVGTGAYIVG